jgi:hypothetical protein
MKNNAELFLGLVSTLVFLYYGSLLWLTLRDADAADRMMHERALANRAPRKEPYRTPDRVVDLRKPLDPSFARVRKIFGKIEPTLVAVLLAVGILRGFSHVLFIISALLLGRCIEYFIVRNAKKRIEAETKLAVQHLVDETDTQDDIKRAFQAGFKTGLEMAEREEELKKRKRPLGGDPGNLVVDMILERYLKEKASIKKP